jgi:cellulose biosynthesis protein BcsQ
MPIMAVVNQKGGTGKMTVATNLAALLARQGTEVLLVDADPRVPRSTGSMTDQSICPPSP